MNWREHVCTTKTTFTKINYGAVEVCKSVFILLINPTELVQLRV